MRVPFKKVTLNKLVVQIKNRQVRYKKNGRAQRKNNFWLQMQIKACKRRADDAQLKLAKSEKMTLAWKGQVAKEIAIRRDMNAKIELQK